MAATLGFTSFDAVMAAATGLESTPKDWSPISRAAKFVVPRPQKGSRIVSPTRALSLSTFNGKLSGNIVK